MRKWWYISALIFALTSCSDPTSDAKKAVLAHLKDPSSVQWQDVRYKVMGTNPQVTYVCGAFNAKNSFGAYVGFKQFVYYQGTLEIAGEGRELEYWVCPPLQ